MSILAGLAGSAIVGTLVSIASKVGAKQVEKFLGKGAGGVAGTIIEAIAETAGVEVPDLDKVPEDKLGPAILAVEEQTPDLVMAWNRQQENTNTLLLAQKKDGPTWTWAWLPAWQWFLMFLWGYSWVLRPIVNAATGADIEAMSIADMIWLTTCYQILHMGGNTGLRMVDKWREARGA